MNFHHVGIACQDIKTTLEFVKQHFEVKAISDMIFDPLQNADLCMVQMADGYQIELISGEVVKSFLKRNQYLYHTCYTVESIDESLKTMDRECLVLGEAKEAVLFGGKRVVFLMTPIGLIELLEA